MLSFIFRATPYKLSRNSLGKLVLLKSLTKLIISYSVNLLLLSSKIINFDNELFLKF